jgi:hypothetical protein
MRRQIRMAGTSLETTLSNKSSSTLLSSTKHSSLLNESSWERIWSEEHRRPLQQQGYRTSSQGPTWSELLNRTSLTCFSSVPWSQRSASEPREALTSLERTTQVEIRIDFTNCLRKRDLEVWQFKAYNLGDSIRKLQRHEEKTLCFKLWIKASNPMMNCLKWLTGW